MPADAAGRRRRNWEFCEQQRRDVPGGVHHPRPGHRGARREGTAPDEKCGYENFRRTKAVAVGVDGDGARGELGEGQEAVDVPQQRRGRGGGGGVGHLLDGDAEIEERRGVVGRLAAAHDQLHAKVAEHVGVAGGGEDGAAAGVVGPCAGDAGVGVGGQVVGRADGDELGRDDDVEVVVGRAVLVLILLHIDAHVGMNVLFEKIDPAIIRGDS